MISDGHSNAFNEVGKEIAEGWLESCTLFTIEELENYDFTEQGDVWYIRDIADSFDIDLSDDETHKEVYSAIQEGYLECVYEHAKYVVEYLDEYGNWITPGFFRDCLFDSQDEAEQAIEDLVADRDWEDAEFNITKIAIMIERKK